MPDARTDVHNKRNYLFLNDNFLNSALSERRAPPYPGTARKAVPAGPPTAFTPADGHDSIFPTPFSSLLRRTSRNTA